MARKSTTSTKKKSPSKKASASTKNETKVTRITATDKPHTITPEEKATKRSLRGLKKSSLAPTKSETIEQESEKKQKRIRNPFAALWAYFRGAWYELRQVRWPDRANTWKMTGALLMFCAFFIVLILLIDAGFKLLFEQLIG